MKPFDPETLTTAQLEALARCAAAGAALASEAITLMTRRPVAVLSPKVRAIPITEVAELLGGAETPVVALHMRIQGGSRGEILIALSPDSAASLLASILERPLTRFEPENMTRMERSVLLEIGNTVAGAYLSALAGITKSSLLLSPPEMAIDMAGAVVDDTLAETARGAAAILLIEMALSADPRGSHALMLHLPDLATLPRLVRSSACPRDAEGCDATGGA